MSNSHGPLFEADTDRSAWAAGTAQSAPKLPLDRGALSPISWVNAGSEVPQPVGGAEHGECRIDFAQHACAALKYARRSGSNPRSHPPLRSDRSGRSWPRCGPLAQLGARRKCSVGGPDPEHCEDEQRRVQAESGGDGGKEPGDAEVEPVYRDETATRARNHAHRIGVHGRDGAPEAQSDVEKAEAEAEADGGRADDAQVQGAEA